MITNQNRTFAALAIYETSVNGGAPKVIAVPASHAHPYEAARAKASDVTGWPFDEIVARYIKTAFVDVARLREWACKCGLANWSILTECGTIPK